MANGTILNNEVNSPESGLRINNPYMTVNYFDKPAPLSGGYMYFGAPSVDPSISENQKRVYIINEDSSITAISQPVSLSSGGVASYNNAPAKLAIYGSYSWAAYDANDNLIYYSAKTSHPSLQQLGEATIVEDVVELIALQIEVAFPNVDLQDSAIDVVGGTDFEDGRGLIKDIDYTIGDGSSGTLFLTNAFPAGTKIRARQNAFTSQEETSVSSYIYAYDSVTSAALENLPVGAKIACMGAATVGDSLTFPFYKVVAGGTGTPDGIRYITMSNGNQLQAIDVRNRFINYTETLGTPDLSSGVLTIDLNAGTTQSITLTESVSSIAFTNAVSGVSSSVTLYVTQDGTGGRGVSFVGLYAQGAVAPTITSTADATDVLVFKTINGTDWDVFQSGEDMGVIV